MAASGENHMAAVIKGRGYHRHVFSGRSWQKKRRATLERVSKRVGLSVADIDGWPWDVENFQGLLPSM